jgi:sRNA-binding regulator protein Hfq
MIAPKQSQPVKGNAGTEPRNYRNPDPLNCGLESKVLTVSMVNGRTESGTCVSVGQYFIEMRMPNGRTLIIQKGAIVSLTVMP